MIGWAIGLAVTALVVLLVVLLIRSASRAANKAEAIVAALDESRENTAGLWDIDTTNRTIGRITASAAAAREYLAASARAEAGRP
jgi:hypothetical protein